MYDSTPQHASPLLSAHHTMEAVCKPTSSGEALKQKNQVPNPPPPHTHIPPGNHSAQAQLGADTKLRNSLVAPSMLPDLLWIPPPNLVLITPFPQH